MASYKQITQGKLIFIFADIISRDIRELQGFSSNIPDSGRISIRFLGL